MHTKFRDQYKAVFGEEYKEDTYKFKPHNFSSGLKAGGKSYCSCCGLVALNNDFSRWSVRMGCFSDVHPEYKNKRKRAGGIK
jgi:hypothetical protein